MKGAVSGPGRGFLLRDICGTALRASAFFSRGPIGERCGHMSGLFKCSRTTAGLDEVREASGGSIKRATQKIARFRVSLSCFGILYRRFIALLLHLTLWLSLTPPCF